MDAWRRRLSPVLVLALTGCTDCNGSERRSLYRQRDLLIQQRSLLAVQQASPQIAIRRELGNRPPESLSQAEQDALRNSPRGQQLAAVTWQLQTVDYQIESVQNRLWNLDDSTTSTLGQR